MVSAGRVIAPILMYHHISDKGSTQYITSVAAFRWQMKALHEAGYQTISIARLVQAIRGGGDLPEKPVILTFDDGYLDVYENAFPILQEYGFTGSAYIITSTLEKGKSYGYMQVEELKALVDAGWEIGSHTVNHANLKTTPAGFSNEVNGSWQDLEKKLFVPIRTFSYPFASANPWIEDQVAKAGYDSAVGVGTFVSHSEKTLYYLSRREVARGITKQAFLDLLVPSEAEILVVTQSASPVTPTP
jgi:peptidoglycan/xylan/chitin deacetylase (PgdA/CDA1 family)